MILFMKNCFVSYDKKMSSMKSIKIKEIIIRESFF